MKRSQLGAGGIFVFVVVLLAIVFIAALFMFSRVSNAVDEQTRTRASLDKVGAALEQYAATTGRLPCPADPSLGPSVDTGVEAVNGSTCSTGLAGTIPWKTIGVGRDDTLDAWGWRISYRVYSAAVGGFTQPTTLSTPTNGGASMVNCSTAPRFDSGVNPANGFCRSNFTTSVDDFTQGKGLTVNEYTDVSAGSASVPSVSHTGIAYVLISHGFSGFGAYTSAGTRLGLPANGPEHDNTDLNSNASPPVSSVAPASSPDIAADKKGHFDDVVTYRTILEVVRRTGLTARAWPFSLTLQAATGVNTPPTLGSNLGVTTLNLGDVQIGGGTIFGGATNISYDAAGGTEGLGVYGGGSGTSIAGTDYLSVTFANSAGKIGISLSGFDSSERASLAFLRNGSFVGSTVTLTGCQSGGNPVASFTVIPGVSFDEIVVTSWPYSSAFLLASVKSCASTDTTCRTPLDSGASPPLGNHCP